MKLPKICPIRQWNPNCIGEDCEHIMPDENGNMRCIWTDDLDVARKYRARPEVTIGHLTGKPIIK